MMLALAILWGGTFFLAEIALAEVPPLTIVLFRVAGAVPVLYAVVRVRGIALPRAARVWGAWLAMGALNNAIPFSLIFWGQTRIESGLAAILNGTAAVFAAVVAAIFLRDEPMTARKLGGAALGLAGVAVIIGPGLLGGLDLTDLAQLAILGAALSYAVAGVWARRTLSDQPGEANAFGMLAGSTVLTIPLVLAVDGVPRVDLAAPVWSALLGLSLLSTVLAYMLYFAILARAGAANLLLVTLLIPPVAVILGAAFLDERLSPGALWGFALIACGLLMTDGRAAARLRRLRRG
ncbi:MAG: DMT family transporter [Roseovarius sp.]|nr:DMT family transporter [Roseovarius sp.]